MQTRFFLSPVKQLLLFLFLSVGPAQAALISSGDGNYTIDTVTGLEWLDITHSVGYSRNNVMASVGSSFGGGWQFASNDQIDNLFTTLFPNNSVNATSRAVYFNSHGVVQIGQVATMNSLFGGGYSGPNIYSWGLFEDENNLIRMMGGYSDNTYSIVYSPDVVGGYSGPFNADYSFSLTGHYLVRNGGASATVPTPGALGLLCVGMLAVAWKQRFDRKPAALLHRH